MYFVSIVFFIHANDNGVGEKKEIPKKNMRLLFHNSRILDISYLIIGRVYKELR